MTLRFDPIRNEFIDDELGTSPSSKILYGEGAPDGSLGSPGDFYIDTQSYSIYQKADTWGGAVSLRGTDGKDGQTGVVGPIGPMGPVGPAGVPGVNGIDGKDGADGLDGVNGFNGLDGKSVELRAVNQVIEWRQEGGEWANLYSFPSMIGSGGGTRKIGELRDVVTQNQAEDDLLVYRDTKWTNVSFSSMTTGFVPYTGAAFDVNLGAHNLICAEVLTDTVIAENLYFNSVPYDVMVCTSISSGQLTNVQMGNNLTFFEGELSVTNAALTRTNDTNVTLTLGGSPSSALLAATSMTLGWTGTLAPSRGGTGASTQVTNAICYYDGSKITTSSNATLSFIAGDVDLLISHPSVAGTTYEVLVTSSSSQYLMAYNTVSTFQGICGTAATENYWTLSTKGLGLSVSAVALWFGSTSNDDLSFYRNNTERLRLTTTGIYVPDVAYLSAASPTINTMVSGTSLIQSSVRLISAYSGAASANSSYFLGSGNDGGLLQLFGAGGTIASPTALTTDSRMGGVFGRGYAATGYSNAVAGVTFHAESTFTDTSTPTYIAFATTASGATTRTERVRISSSGNFGVNVVPTAKLHVVKALYETPSLTFGSDCATIIRGESAELACGFGYPSCAGMYLQARYSTNTSLPLFLNPVGGNVAIATNDTSRRLVVAGVGATNDKLLYLRQTNDYGYSFNLDSSSSGRMYLYGVNAGAETSAIMTFDRTNTYVGVNSTPSFRFHVNENQGYTSRAANPLPAQIVVQSGASGFLKMGNYYTGGVGTCSTIQSTDLFSGTDHGTNLLLNPLGGNVGIGEDAPNFTLVARYASAYPQISARYDGTSASNYKELQLGYNGSSGSGYAWIQALHNGTAYTPICLNPYGSDVIIGGLSTPRAKLEVVGDIWTDWEDRFIGTVYQAGAAYKMGIKATTGVRALDLIAMSADSSSIRFWTGATPSVNAYIDHVSNVVLGNQSALATNATNGFLYVRTCAGTPTGAPTAFTGHVAMLYDTTNNKWWAYNGSWRSVTLT